jgi:secreted PhoX family phosphatase
MTTLDRRTVLKGAAAAGIAAFAGPFSGLLNGPVALAKPKGATLVPIADKRGNVVRLWLPEGFNYRSFHDTESPVTLSDGTTLPGRHDGMAAFAGPGGNVILVRNHEVNAPGPAFGPTAPTSADLPYDPMAQGGTTTIEVTPFGEVVRAFTSLNGTQMNCSGGPTPWGSWITCEETVNGPDVGADFTGVSNVPLTKPHGYLFEVPAGGKSNRQPITMAGRFAHEAIAVDPHSGTIYMTEDNFGYPAGFYRFVPKVNPMKTGFLDNEGTLQMLAVRGMSNANLAAAQPAGVTYDVEWVDIEDPDPTFPYTPGEPAPTPNDTALNYVGSQGRAKGAAYFSRLEGAYFEANRVYFTSTQGGGAAETSTGPIADGFGNGSGQVWCYHLDSQKLSLVYESPGPDVLDLPDNVTVSKRGTIVLCEDNVNDNYLRGLTRNGFLFDIALNRLRSSTGADRSNDEFAGATFSPDGHTLFVNIQASRGMTFAIWGPWHKIGV